MRLGSESHFVARSLLPVVCVFVLVSLSGVANRLVQAQTALERAQLSVSTNDAPLRSVTLRGRAAVNNTDGSRVMFPVEIRMEFPDRYLRTEDRGILIRRSGFSGEVLLNAVRPADPARVTPIVRLPENQLDLERAAMRRFALGLVAAVVPEAKMLRQERGTVEGRDLMLLHFSDPVLGELRLGVDEATRFPVAVVTRQAIRLPVAQPSLGPPQPEVLDVVDFFDDRRLTSGYYLPFTIRRMAGGVNLETLTIDEVDVNPAFTDADFDQEVSGR